MFVTPMKPICIAVLAIAADVAACGASMDRLISVRLPPGWVEVQAVAPGGGAPQFPTSKYVPKDGRNAEILVTILGRGNGKISNLKSLRELFPALCRPYLATPDDHVESTELKLAHGVAIYASFEDPDLIGKPSQPGNFKVATPVAILLDQGIVAHATMLTDELMGGTFREALQIVESIAFAGTGPRAPAGPQIGNRGDSIVISVPSLDAELGVPRRGFSEAPAKLDEDGSYFSFSRDDGVIISGWLEPASKFQGLRKLWATDKQGIESGMGIKCQDEAFEAVGNWQAVLYTVRMRNDFVERNVRACCVAGNTWVDVHISTANASIDTEALRKLLRSLSLVTRKPNV